MKTTNSLYRSINLKFTVALLLIGFAFCNVSMAQTDGKKKPVYGLSDPRLAIKNSETLSNKVGQKSIIIRKPVAGSHSQTGSVNTVEGLNFTDKITRFQDGALGTYEKE
jgi:hypothetical protein